MMAYYSSSFDDANFGEYYRTPYDDCGHDFLPSQTLVAHSSYGYDSGNYYDYNYNSFQYDPAPSYDSYDPDIGHSVVAYSAYTCGEPNYVEYELDPYGEHYHTVKTRFISSYSVSDQFNVPDFEEYDPTPYGGGYDPVATYGKPLSPSEKTCYPRSSEDPNDQLLNNFSYGSIESPYGKGATDDPLEKPRNVSKTTTPTANDPVEKPYNGSKTTTPTANDPVTSNKDAESEENDPVRDHGNIGAIEDHGNEYERRVPQIPPGYGLEAMDLCESLFGYWPCLARAKRENDGRNTQQICSEGIDENFLYEGTADYLFGSSFPYGERWSERGIYENPLFNYERHYQEQSICRRVEYHEEYSWLN